MMSNRVCCYNHGKGGTEDKGLCDSKSKVHGHEDSDGPIRICFHIIFILIDQLPRTEENLELGY